MTFHPSSAINSGRLAQLARTIIQRRPSAAIAALVIFGCQSQPQLRSGVQTNPGANKTAASGLAGAASQATSTANQGTATEPSPQCAPPPTRPTVTNGTNCGPLDCRAFVQAEDAIAYVMRETTPLVLAVGEIHAQKGAAIKASPTQLFSMLLPLFCGNTRHIVIELWTPRNDCGDKRVEAVRQAQKPVVEAQAATNQNDFLELGNVAKKNRIQPHALTPTCDDFQSILAANDQDIERMLVLTATRTADLTEELLNRTGTKQSSPTVILYGGAMHNDVNPAEGREAFSYGPRLEASTRHRLTELDIVLREQVKDTASYQRLPWYPHFRKATLDKQYLLYRLGTKSFTLIYPNAPE
jgi:hypothetical protein